jgi:regulator of protease activity HflC (stomatin/prohibitin superfamily)
MSEATTDKLLSTLSSRKVFSVVIALVVLVGSIWAAMNMFENLDAGEVMVIQSPISGELTWHTTPGIKWQGFGKVTKYERRMQFWFSAKPDQGKPTDESLRIRFNDGGHAQISGGISWEMPLDADHLTIIHQKFGNQKAVEQQLVRTMIEKSVYMTGPLMSSTESYASRRSELLKLMEDQVSGGIYQTKTVVESQKDPITGAERKVSVVQLVTDKDGKYLRVEESPLKEFGIRAFNLSINQIAYEGKVEEQIQQQQQAAMQVQIAIAEAKRAEQQVLTTQKEGEASAAKAEWAQKTVAAKLEAEALMKKNVAETEAKQKLEVAKLDTEAAEQFKKAETLRGEGEAARRKLVMEADGALEKKLTAWLESQKAYAEAIGKHQGQWVPSVVMGGNGGNAGAGQVNGAQALIDLFTARAAKDLGLDLSMSKQEKK